MLDEFLQAKYVSDALSWKQRTLSWRRRLESPVTREKASCGISLGTRMCVKGENTSNFYSAEWTVKKSGSRSCYSWVKWSSDAVIVSHFTLIKHFAVIVMGAAVLKAVKVRSAVLNRE
jgi:hypothetical protein